MLDEEFELLMAKERKEDDNFIKQHAEEVRGEYKCKETGTTIVSFTVYWSIHDGFAYGLGHSGGGRVYRQERPLCPRCKSPAYKTDRGCIDVTVPEHSFKMP